MAPELARRIVCEYSDPDELVVDPFCGIGTTLVEAARLGRRAVGIEIEPRWADLARANLAYACPDDATLSAEVRTGDARGLTEAAPDLAGTVGLVATSPPYGCDVGNPDRSAWGAGGGLCPVRHRNYSPERTNLGHARAEAYLEAVAQAYAGSFALLRPGGVMVTVTRNTRRDGACFDLAAVTVEIARRIGFTYLQHVVALLCALRGGDLAARPSFWQLVQTRRARSHGRPVHLVAHEDVLVFTKGESRG
jgi:DNA modification methylase